MNAQQLKNSILQEAIEGRLVPQDPSDEPASVLLDKIRKEKAKLVKEGKLKKKDLEEIPISEDEIPFKIPENWEWVRLGQICIVQDIDHKMPEKKNEGIPYVSPLDFYGDNGINYTNAKKISKEDFLKLSKKCLPRKGDIIFPRYGTIGAVRLIETEIDFLVSYSCATIKTILNNTYSKYIFYSLQSPFIKKVEIEKYINKTTQPNVGLQSILKFLLPFPPLAEQERIVAKIEELLPKVEEYGKAQERLNKLNEELPERLKKSILQEAITGRLVPQDPNDEPASTLLDKIRAEKKRLVKEGKLKKKDLEENSIIEDEISFKIPKSWEWVRYSELFTVRSAKRIHQSDWQKDGIPFFRGRELIQLIKTGNVESENCITQELYNSLKVYGIPAKDDILISAVGTIGRVYIVKGTRPFYYKDAYILCCENIGKIKPNYVAMALTAPFLQKQIHQDSMATTVAQLTIEKAKSLLIPLPPLAEQKRIVEKIEQLMKEIDKLRV